MSNARLPPRISVALWGVVVLLSGDLSSGNRIPAWLSLPEVCDFRRVPELAKVSGLSSVECASHACLLHLMAALWWRRWKCCADSKEPEKKQALRPLLLQCLGLVMLLLREDIWFYCLLKNAKEKSLPGSFSVSNTPRRIKMAFRGIIRKNCCFLNQALVLGYSGHESVIDSWFKQRTYVPKWLRKAAIYSLLLWYPWITYCTWNRNPKLRSGVGNH